MTTPPEPHVQVTTEMIYRSVADIAASIQVINVKLDQAIGRVNDHEARLRELERARWPLPTLAILIALAAMIIGGINLVSK